MATSGDVAGCVVDIDRQSAISDAVVDLSVSGGRGITDSTGFFVIHTASANVNDSLVLRRIGYVRIAVALKIGTRFPVIVDRVSFGELARGPVGHGPIFPPDTSRAAREAAKNRLRDMFRRAAQLHSMCAQRLAELKRAAA